MVIYSIIGHYKQTDSNVVPWSSALLERDQPLEEGYFKDLFEQLLNKHNGDLEDIVKDLTGNHGFISLEHQIVNYEVTIQEEEDYLLSPVAPKSVN